MFHIANKIYLEYDFKFMQGNYSYMIASERLCSHPMVITPTECQYQVPLFGALLENDFDGDYNKFWTMLLSKHHKFVAYLTPDDLLKLQLQYWKSIFEDSLTAEQAYLLYQTWVESERIVSYTYSWTVTPTSSRSVAHRELSMMSLEEFTVEFDEADTPPVLLTLDKTLCGIEYLLADYFADGDTPNKPALIERVKELTWDNWLDELGHLRYEILSGAVDAWRIDPTIETPIGEIETALAGSDLLSWTVDPNFGEDVEYIRENYDYTVFNPCWTKLADAWGIPYDDMDELNEMINTDQYEELIMRDVNRNYGCSYTRTRYMDKCNQVFATFAYDCVRKDETNKLNPYKLRR